MKQAEALKNDADEIVPGTTTVYEDPPGRAAGSIDAPWGEDPHPDANHNGDAAWAAHQETRSGVLGRLFTNTAGAADNAKKTISENFDHGGQGEYEAHTALLNYKSAAVHAPPGETLTDQVRRVCGRR